METVVKKRRPLAFYLLSLGFTFERCAYYTAKYVLTIWIALSLAKGGLGLGEKQGALISAIFVAATYITPIVGGFIADHFLSPRICVVLGAVLMGIGYLFAWQAKSIALIWVMIAFVAVGTGFFKGNLSGLNGSLFSSQDELDSAFSIQYTFVNIGSFIGTTFLTLLIATTGHTFIFLIAAILLFFDAIWLAVASRMLGDIGKKPFKHDSREYVTKKEKNKNEGAPLTKIEKKRIGAIILVTFFSIIFWAVWYMTYMPVYYYWGPDFQNNANWAIGSFTIPAAWFDSLNALCCITLGPILAIVWTKLSKRPQGDMSMFKKTALGMGLMGAAFLIMAAADIIRGGRPASILWIIMVGLLMSVGEMVFSPLGNSFINKFAPAKLLGFLLGLWPIAVFFATMVYPPIYSFLSDQSNFALAYGIVGAIVLVCGIILWVMSKGLDGLTDEQN